jgi:hypothetical protein
LKGNNMQIRQIIAQLLKQEESEIQFDETPLSSVSMLAVQRAVVYLNHLNVNELKGKAGSLIPEESSLLIFDEVTRRMDAIGEAEMLETLISMVK